MTPPFLRGRRVTLHATDARCPLPPDAWFDPGARHADHDEVLLAVRAADGSDAGTVGLTALDWTRHEARLCGGGPGATVGGMEDAVRLAVAYAFEELNLETLDAWPLAEAAGQVALRMGFRSAGAGGGLTLRRLPPLGPR